MSTIQTNSITDAAGTGAPDFPNGIEVSAGNVGIGTSSPAVKLEVLSGGTFDSAIHIGDTGSSRRLILEQTDATNYTIGGTGTSANTIFVSGGTAGIGTEAARIDSSGNLLVGMTSSSSAADGCRLLGIGSLTATRDGSNAAVFNRKTSDGSIVELRKDDATVGLIHTQGDARIGIGNLDTGLLFNGDNDSIHPWNPTSNAVRSGAIDLGNSSNRWNTVYAAVGTINTSDRNEKQDIEELNDAERRVAVACKGLLRKYRLKSAIAKKGEDARIHFGIIAQDLQDAFTAEGLDAGRYAMFIHSTWTDEETGEKKSLMGVRYSELLAFMIAVL